MISRRDAVKLGAMGTMIAPFGRLNSSAFASRAGSSTWNWAGNSGRTGELPGPGLDFNAPLGEVWRLAGSDDLEVSGLLDDILYFARRTEDWGWVWRVEAVSCEDGSSIWAQNAPGYLNYQPNGSDMVPEISEDGVAFSSQIAIANGQVICTLSNGHLMAFDAKTGIELWDFDTGKEQIYYPTVTNDTIYFLHADGVSAVKLGEAPSLRWEVEAKPNQQLLGVSDGFVWIATHRNLIAIEVDSGNEYWRIPADDIYRSNQKPLGVSKDIAVLQHDNPDVLTAVNGEGIIKWQMDDSLFNREWIMNNVIIRTTPTSSNWDSCRVQCLSIQDEQPLWDFDLNTDRWGFSSGYSICDGVAYATFYDSTGQERVLLAVDPQAQTIHGQRGTILYPAIVSDGLMIAIDAETDEFVCIGSVPGTLRPGGRAKLTRETTLYGAPSTSSIDRGKVEEGIELEVTGDPESTNSGDWYPISIPNSDLTGWLPASSLLGLVGDIVFEPMDINIFGQITTY